MVFAASPDTSIRAFDTYFFNQQKKIAIRDPIIGPLRVAFDATSAQQYLFGIRPRLVVISLPTITNTNRKRRRDGEPRPQPLEISRADPESGSRAIIGGGR